jgi:hypothetical protein
VISAFRTLETGKFFADSDLKSIAWITDAFSYPESYPRNLCSVAGLADSAWDAMSAKRGSHCVRKRHSKLSHHFAYHPRSPRPSPIPNVLSPRSRALKSRHPSRELEGLLSNRLVGGERCGNSCDLHWQLTQCTNENAFTHADLLVDD